MTSSVHSLRDIRRSFLPLGWTAFGALLPTWGISGRSVWAAAAG
ncbi:hypothetical protein [Corynebacterium sp.]|nr:hypothetical protein [Corynebacterium sp.]